jgi:hypothetical protein
VLGNKVFVDGFVNGEHVLERELITPPFLLCVTAQSMESALWGRQEAPSVNDRPLNLTISEISVWNSSVLMNVSLSHDSGVKLNGFRLSRTVFDESGRQPEVSVLNFSFNSAPLNMVRGPESSKQSVVLTVTPHNLYGVARGAATTECICKCAFAFRISCHFFY